MLNWPGAALFSARWRRKASSSSSSTRSTRIGSWLNANLRGASAPLLHGLGGALGAVPEDIRLIRLLPGPLALALGPGTDADGCRWMTVTLHCVKDFAAGFEITACTKGLRPDQAWPDARGVRNAVAVAGDLATLRKTRAHEDTRPVATAFVAAAALTA